MPVGGWAPTGTLCMFFKDYDNSGEWGILLGDTISPVGWSRTPKFWDLLLATSLGSRPQRHNSDPMVQHRPFQPFHPRNGNLEKSHVSCLNRAWGHVYIPVSAVQSSERWSNFPHVAQLAGTRLKTINLVSWLFLLPNPSLYSRFDYKLSIWFVSKVRRHPMFKCVFSFALFTWQAKHLFQIEIFRLRVELTFRNDQNIPNLIW